LIERFKVIRTRERIVEITSLKANDNELELREDVEGYIELRNASYENERGDKVLDKVNLSLFKFSLLGVFGKNENDLKDLELIFSGVLKLSSGKLLYDNSEKRHQDIVTVPRDGVVFLGTVIENITMFDSNKEGQAKEIIELLDIQSLLAELPLGYQTKLDYLSNSSLSKELIVWISFARALLTYPKIILINNSQYSLEEKSKIKFFNIVNQLSKSRNIVWIIPTNDEVIMKRCPQKLELISGELKEIRSKDVVL